MTPSQACIDLVKEFEGCRLTAYDDAQPNKVLVAGDAILGTLTIGYGHTGPDVVIGQVWTQADADRWVMVDAVSAAFWVSQAVIVPLTQGQFDALTDFVYNEGAGQFAKSTLLRLLNAGHFPVIPYQLYHDNPPGGWIYADGQIQPGLIRRRQAEIVLWNS